MELFSFSYGCTKLFVYYNHSTARLYLLYHGFTSFSILLGKMPHSGEGLGRALPPEQVVPRSLCKAPISRDLYSQQRYLPMDFMFFSILQNLILWIKSFFVASCFLIFPLPPISYMRKFTLYSIAKVSGSAQHFSIESGTP